MGPKAPGASGSRLHAPKQRKTWRKRAHQPFPLVLESQRGTGEVLAALPIESSRVGEEVGALVGAGVAAPVGKAVGWAVGLDSFVRNAVDSAAFAVFCRGLREDLCSVHGLLIRL